MSAEVQSPPALGNQRQKRGREGGCSQGRLPGGEAGGEDWIAVPTVDGEGHMPDQRNVQGPPWKRKIIEALWNTSLGVSNKTKHRLSYGPAVSLLSIDLYTGEMKTYVHKNTYMRMFVAALFILAPNWNQPKSSSSTGNE